MSRRLQYDGGSTSGVGVDGQSATGHSHYGDDLCDDGGESRRVRERDFLKRVHDCVSKGGKVLIPVFALGRAQELCILLDMYWERMNLAVPIYFSAGTLQTAHSLCRSLLFFADCSLSLSLSVCVCVCVCVC